MSDLKGDKAFCLLIAVQMRWREQYNTCNTLSTENVICMYVYIVAHGLGGVRTYVESTSMYVYCMYTYVRVHTCTYTSTQEGRGGRDRRDRQLRCVIVCHNIRIIKIYIFKKRVCVCVKRMECV